MNLPWQKEKLPYSREELADHIGMLSDLITKREKSLQGAILKQSDVQQQKYLEEVERYDNLIHTAQLSLDFMLQKNLKRVRDN